MSTQEHNKGFPIETYNDFTYLYEVYAPRLYAFIFGLTHSEVTTKDIVQDTFIKIWVGRKDIRPGTSFKSYLFTMARNQLLNEIRRQVNQTVSIEDLSITNNESLGHNNIELEISIKEFKEELNRAKKKLTPRQRELFELNREQGISVAELAESKSITEQSIRNQLSQAIQTLRSEMKNFYTFFNLFF